MGINETLEAFCDYFYNSQSPAANIYYAFLYREERLRDATSLLLGERKASDATAC